MLCLHDVFSAVMADQSDLHSIVSTAMSSHSSRSGIKRNIVDAYMSQQQNIPGVFWQGLDAVWSTLIPAALVVLRQGHCCEEAGKFL